MTTFTFFYRFGVCKDLWVRHYDINYQPNDDCIKTQNSTHQSVFSHLKFQNSFLFPSFIPRIANHILHFRDSGKPVSRANLPIHHSTLPGRFLHRRHYQNCGGFPPPSHLNEGLPLSPDFTTADNTATLNNCRNLDCLLRKNMILGVLLRIVAVITCIECKDNCKRRVLCVARKYQVVTYLYEIRLATFNVVWTRPCGFKGDAS